MKKAYVKAPAKVNLFLHVVGKREDGYHDLVTRMQKLDLYDYVTVEVNDSGVVTSTCTDSSLPLDEGNLAVRAGKSYLAQSRVLSGAGLSIHLEKNIPVAAGLGGGSSDAGAVLRGLNYLSNGEFSEKELAGMAKPLGADVPFFAVEHNAVLAEGIGEIMYPVDSLTDFWVILINPGFFVSTAEIFRKLSLTTQLKTSTVALSRVRSEKSFTVEAMHNDLEIVTGSMYPEIDRMKDSLVAVGAGRVLMSGSGPTVFGLFKSSEACSESYLRRIVDGLRQEYGEKVFLSKACTGASPSGKAPGFDPGIRRFESCRPSHQ